MSHLEIHLVGPGKLTDVWAFADLEQAQAFASSQPTHGVHSEPLITHALGEQILGYVLPTDPEHDG